LCFSESKTENSTASTKAVGFLKHIKLLSEFYNESIAFQRLGDNFISYSNSRLGLRISGIPKIAFELYILGRYGRDLHKDFWNNRVETGVGFRFRFFSKVFLALYTDLIRGYYLKVPDEYPQANEDTYNDFRTGLIFWYGWVKPIIGKRTVSFLMKPMGEIYSDVSYFRNQRHNVISYVNIKSGFHILRVWKVSLDGYGVIYVTKDVNEDFWNNKAEIGPGIRLRPIPGVELKLFAEWLYGTYFGIEGEDVNPYPQRYQDRRIGLTFWYGW
jgi:hypothetical protein